MATFARESPLSFRTSIAALKLLRAIPSCEANRSSSASPIQTAVRRVRPRFIRRTVIATGRCMPATRRPLLRKYLLAEKHGVNFEGAVTWAFEFEDQPYFAGFRVLSTNGITLPVLNVFRMFGLMGGQRVEAESSAEIGLEAIRSQGVRSKPDVGALASTQDGKTCVLIWHFHDEDVPGPTADVTLSLSHAEDERAPVLVQHYRIDRSHSNGARSLEAAGITGSADC